MFSGARRFWGNTFGLPGLPGRSGLSGHPEISSDRPPRIEKEAKKGPSSDPKISIRTEFPETWIWPESVLIAAYVLDFLPSTYPQIRIHFYLFYFLLLLYSFVAELPNQRIICLIIEFPGRPAVRNMIILNWVRGGE